MISIFGKPKFKPQNGFSTLAYFATENQIKLQKLKNPHGKLECFLFYSTYLSLLTSTLYPKYSDKVDQLLVNGIWSYKEYLKLGEFSYIEFPEYVENRGRIYTDCIDEILQNFNGRDGIVLPTFVLMFETSEMVDLDQVDMSDLFSVTAGFEIVKSNIQLISREGYYQCAKLEGIPAERDQESFIVKGPESIKKLVVLPFRKPRCKGCGSFKKRDELLLTTIYDDGSFYLMPMCAICKAKFGYQDDRI